MTAESTGPLQGMRVLDLTSVVMGPLSTRMLGDLGADVITIEPPQGDRNRSMGAGPHEELSGVALNLMRNKRSVTLDLKLEPGREVFLELAATADVMITNLRPGPLGRLRLTYEDVQPHSPDIVYCAARGFPADSPNADKPAFDDIIQSATGFGDMFARMGAEPTLVPTLVADKVCGMAIANAVLAALVHKGRTGAGQFVEIPMIEIMRAFVLEEHGSAAISEPPLGPAGYPRILTTARRPQPTKDGFINVLPYSGDNFNKIFEAGGRHDLMNDERMSTRVQRTLNSDSLYRDVASVLATRTTDEWLAFCGEHNIAATRAGTLDDLVQQLPLGEHPIAGTYRVIPPYGRFSKSPGDVRRPAPLIGEQTAEVLGELGYSDSDLAELAEHGVIQAEALEQ